MSQIQELHTFSPDQSVLKSRNEATLSTKKSVRHKQQ